MKKEETRGSLGKKNEPEVLTGAGVEPVDDVALDAVTGGTRGPRRSGQGMDPLAPTKL